jgi:hypothetical protein
MDERTRKIVNGQGYVPYRGQPEPDKPKSYNHRPLTRSEKWRSGCFIGFCVFLSLIVLGFGIYFLIRHDSTNALMSLFVFIFTVFLDAFFIGSVKFVNRHRKRNYSPEKN